MSYNPKEGDRVRIHDQVGNVHVRGYRGTVMSPYYGLIRMKLDKPYDGRMEINVAPEAVHPLFSFKVKA